jgi:AcrR family transcriptional regulator
MRKSETSPVDTREHILNTAGRIFAEHGFHATTVRQITCEAGVNLAAVNYHYRDKQELYISVLKRAHQAAASTAGADLPGPPQARLRTFIKGFLAYLLDPRRPEWHGSLIAREMAQPTHALDRLVAESIEPVKQRIGGIVREILPCGISGTQLNLACFSILGQCLYYVHCREMISRLFPEERHAYRDVDVLTEHVFRFSLAGLTALRKKLRPPAARRRSSPRKISL